MRFFSASAVVNRSEEPITPTVIVVQSLRVTFVPSSLIPSSDGVDHLALIAVPNIPVDTNQQLDWTF